MLNVVSKCKQGWKVKNDVWFQKTPEKTTIQNKTHGKTKNFENIIDI